MTTLNPTLEGWAIVLSNGINFIGRYHTPKLGEHATLSPVFQFTCGIGEAPWRKGRPSPVYMTQRVLLLGSLKKITVPESAIVIPMEDLDTEERTELGRWVQFEETFTKNLRLQQSGLSIPGH